jgi:nucleoside 2-deoxyribosyltransferase
MNATEKLIYLASPYSDPEPSVMTARHDVICRVAGILMSRGILVYSPIAHTHPIAVVHDLPRDWKFWQRFDERMIRASDEVMVCTMPGWNKSRGVAAELDIARALGKPVGFVDPTGAVSVQPSRASTARGRGIVATMAAVAPGNDG